ncbi:glutamate receptor ionotropic, delta-2-like [Panulirus ornatus]|uniref:glutamate receptor ionotropic, delta-2-like n=1 Tax=Panulirus ornatus TaxID=150431 RepID=UPI003A851D76
MLVHSTTAADVALTLMVSAAVARELPFYHELTNATADRTVPEQAMLLDLLAKTYTSKCLRVVVGDTGLWIRSWKHSHVSINPDGSQAKQAVDFMNRHMEKVTVYACVTYLMTQIPGPQVLMATTDLANKQVTRYFIVRASSISHAQDFLLDERLRNEEHVAAIVRKERQSGNIWQVFTRQLLHPTGSPEFQLKNRWSLARGLGNTEELFPEQMGNFYGAELTGVTLDFRPFTDYETVPGSRVVKPKPSLDVFILDVIARKLNFTYKLEVPEDGLWGFLKDDGHWVGVVGDVEFRRANFSLVLSVTLERRISVDFTRSYYRDPLSFVTAKSRPQPPWLKLITPFTTQVWLLGVASVALAAVLYYFIFRIQSTFGSFTLPPSRAFMHIFGAFLSQSLFVMPWFSAGKLFLGFWFVYSLLVTTYYKTSLMATLAVPSIPPTIDTLEQLFRSNLKFGMIDAKGSEYQLFSTSNVSLYQKMFQKMSFYSSDESMRLVAEGKYAYVYFKSNLETIVSTQYTSISGKTDLHVATEEFFPGGYGWAFPKGAPYRRTFDDIMWRCVQGGLIDMWVRDLYSIYLNENLQQKTPRERKAEKEAALSKNNDGLVVLNLNHFQGAFLTLFLGSGAGILLLLMECVGAKLLRPAGSSRQVSGCLRYDEPGNIKYSMMKST